MVKREGGQSGSRKRSSGGHPSRGGTTVGGGTKGKKPTKYKSPTPSVKRQRQVASTPKPDVTLGGDVTPRRSGHKKSAHRPAAPYSLLDVKKGKRFKSNRTVSKKKLDRSTRAYRALRRADRERDTDTGINVGPIHFNVEAELEGRGGLAKAGRFVGSKLSKSAGTALRTQGVGLPPQLDKYVGRAVKDAADLPAQTIASTYAVGAGAKEAAQGRPKRLKELGKQLKEHDPVALAAQGRFKEAGKAASEHPLATGLEVTGLGKGLSRAPNRIVKPKARTRTVPGTAVRQVERKPEGVVGRGVRKHVDKRKVKQARKLYRKADEAQRQGESTGAVQELRRRAALKDPRRVSDREIRKRYDQREALAEARRRKHRGEALKKADKALDKNAEAQLLVAQKVVKPTRESVRRYREQVEREAPKRDVAPARAATNKRLQKSLKRIEKQDLSKVAARAEDYGKVVRPLQKELVQRGVLDVRQERMAKLIPYAVQEMGAKWNPGKRGEPGRLEALVRRPVEQGRDVATQDIAYRSGTGIKALEQAVELGWAEKVRSFTLPPSPKTHGRRGTHRLSDAQVARVEGLAKAAGLTKRRVNKDGSITFYRPAGKKEAGFVEEAAPLSVEQIEAHMRSQGIDPESVAFVSQHPRTKGPRNYYISWQAPKGLMSQRRTGEATRKGTFDVSREVGRENVARMQGLIDAHNEYAEFVKEFGYRGGGKSIKRFRTKKEAEEFIENLKAKPVEHGGNLTASAHDWRAVPTRPPFGKREQSESLLDQADTDIEQLPARDTVGKALEGEGDGKYVLVLDSAADQMQKHLRVLDPTAGGKALRFANRQFSSAVLSTNPAWVAGNTIEATLRSAVRGAGPIDRKFAGSVVKRLREIDPKMADELELRIGAGQAGMLETQMIYTTAEQFRGSAFEKLAFGMGAARRTQPVKLLGDLWKGYTHFVFDKNGLLEAQFKKAMLGQYAKQFLMDKKTLASWDKAVDQAARGLKNTNEQIAAAEWVRRAYGQYEAWGPTGRKLIANYTPFVAWTINAGRFLASVMPKDHPLQTALLIGAYNATEEWRHEQGQGRGILGEQPSWLQGALPLKDKWLRVSRFTPFGLASDPFGTAGGLVVPQISGALMATKGLDWKGDPLYGHERPGDVTDGERGKGALSALMGAFVPGLNQVQAVKKHGAQGLNPFRPLKRQSPELSRAFAERTKIDDLPGKLSDHPKAHARYRELQEKIYRLSKGQYGHHYKTSLDGSSSSSGGSGWDQFREGSAPKQKSGWDAYR